jgi:phenylacetate-coenzyme A ligase PaaK-like adenylate-forming protein
MRQKYTRRLFKLKKPYDLKKSDQLFVAAMKENAIFQYENCLDYKRILDDKDFNPYKIKDFDDLIDLPFIPTLYFKRHEMFSMPNRRILIKATSSGTSGVFSKIGFNIRSLLRGLRMVIRVGRYHKLWSIRPVKYILFGYQPKRKNKMAITKTAFGFTFFAPALKRVYALRWVNGEYKVDLENIKQELIKASRGKTPVRTIGFPAYTYFLLKEMKSEGIKINLPKGSLITVGGGWKQFYTEKVDKEDFYNLVEEVLGVKSKNCVEFFGAVEHPILYTDCRCHHFHIPVFARVVIRDPDTFKALPNKEVGMLNLMTPMVDSVPLLSVMTDDLAVIHDEGCECGETSPWLEIIGRMGISDIVTCAAGAEEFLKSMEDK